MSEFFWKRLNLYGTWIFIAVLFSFLSFLLGVEIKDFDLWLHLAVGKYIVHTGIVPDVDILSFTRAGMPWNNHEWLFQVMAYLFYAAAGAEGLVMMQTIIVMLTVSLLVLMGYNRDRPLAPILTLMIVVMVYKTRFTHRPDLVSLLFFTSYVYILSSFLCRRWALAALFIVQVLWTNMHGFFIFGPLMMLLGVLAEYIRRFVPLPFEWNSTGKLDNEEFKRMHIGFLVVCAACFVNPTFIEGVMYPLKIMFSLGGDNEIFFRHIRELQKPITKETIFAMQPYFFFRLMIMVSFASFLLNFRKIDISALMMWAVFLIFSITASRNIVFFAIMGYFAVLVNLQYLMTKDIKPLLNPRTTCILSILCKFVIGAWMIKMMFALSLNGYYDFAKMERKPEFDGQFSVLEHPFDAAKFLKENNIQGNFLNDFNSGAFLTGQVFPAIKVFIDGRTELYGPDFFEKYHTMWRGDTKILEEMLKKYPVTGVFLNSKSTDLYKPLVQFFHESPEWVMIYFDYDAIIYLKDIPMNKQWIDEFAMDISKRKVEPIDLYEVGYSRISAREFYLRGRNLFFLEQLNQAKIELQSGLDLNPIESGLYHILGKIHYKQGDYEQSFVRLRQARVLAGGSIELMYDIGRTLYKLGKLDKAREQCDWADNGGVDSQRFSMFCAELDLEQEKVEEAKKRFDNIKKFKHYFTDEIDELGDAFYKHEQYEYASKAYAKALELDPDNSKKDKWQEKIIIEKDQ